MDPSVPVFQVEPMDRVVAAMLARRRTSMLVLGLFAACAVAMAGLGVYGVSSYTVGLRTREFGVRLALGAGKAQVPSRSSRSAWPAASRPPSAPHRWIRRSRCERTEWVTS